jgi:hypothetical protein
LTPSKIIFSLMIKIIKITEVILSHSKSNFKLKLNQDNLKEVTLTLSLEQVQVRTNLAMLQFKEAATFSSAK